MIEIRNLSRYYGEEPGVREVNLSIEPGDRMGIVGPNGAGKSTLLRLIAGHLRPTSGQVLLEESNIYDQPISRGQIGFFGHASMVYEQLTARENLEHYGLMYGMEGSGLDEAITKRLKQVGLLSRAEQRVDSFSSGMKKRLSLARALLHEPRVLVLDEPFRGLDQSSTRTVQSIIKKEITGERYLFLASHDLQRVFEAVEEILMLFRTRPVWRKDLQSHSYSDLSRAYRDVTGEEIQVAGPDSS